MERQVFRWKGLDSSDYEILRKSLMSPGDTVLSEE